MTNNCRHFRYPQPYGYQSLLTPELNPFHYRKTVKFGQSPRIYNSMPMNYNTFMMPISDYKVGYHRPHLKPKSKRPSVFPDFFGRFKKPKTRKKPSFLYQPFPITAIQQEMKPITVVDSDPDNNLITPDDSILVPSHINHDSGKNFELSDLEPNPRRLEEDDKVTSDKKSGDILS